jgi:anti-sigma factor RsiW
VEKGPDQQRLTPAERVNLVAYLDGELTDGEAQVIATKLTKSPTARREVEALERTWEMLDYLPRPKASEDLTARTMTQIHELAQKGGRLESAIQRTALKVLRAALGIVASAAILLVGFAITHWVWPNPTARLARDLPIAEHLDEYREVGTFEFLDELANSPEFNTERD